MTVSEEKRRFVSSGNVLLTGHCKATSAFSNTLGAHFHLKSALLLHQSGGWPLSLAEVAGPGQAGRCFQFPYITRLRCREEVGRY